MPPGYGHIGHEKLNNIIKIANEYNIPMVIE